MLRYLTAATLLVLAGEALAAKRPRVPPGQWAVDYDKEYCVLSRDGLVGEPSVAIRTRPLFDEHDLMIYGLPRGLRRGWSKGWVHTADGMAGAERWLLVERGSGRRETVVDTTITAEEITDTIRNGFVRLTGQNGIDLRAPLPNIGKALAALRTCEEDLAKRWGVDPSLMKAWAKPARAKSDLRELFWSKNPSQYGVLQSHHVRAVIDVDEKGNPVNCKIVERSRVAWVNAHICETILKEGRFDPAIDTTGKPVPGKVVTPRITSVRLR